VLGVPNHSPLYHAPVGTHLGTLKGKFARTCAAMLPSQIPSARTRSCGPAWIPRMYSTPYAPCLSSHGGLRVGRRFS